MTAALELETGPSPASVAPAGPVSPIPAGADRSRVVAGSPSVEGDGIACTANAAPSATVEGADTGNASGSARLAPAPSALNVQHYDDVYALPWHQASPPASASRPAVERRRAAVAATRTLAERVFEIAGRPG